MGPEHLEAVSCDVFTTLIPKHRHDIGLKRFPEELWSRGRLVKYEFDFKDSGHKRVKPRSLASELVKASFLLYSVQSWNVK